jgi:superfamily II DNA/RNA helicase
MSTKDCARVGFSKDNKEDDNYIADCKYLIPASLSQQYCIVEERKRLTYLLSIIMFSGSAKIIIFVSTCDEVEYLEMVLQSLIYKRDEEENVK